MSQPKVHPGSVTIKGATGEFLKGGSNFIEDGSLGQFILMYTDILMKMIFSLKGGGGVGRGRVNNTKPLCNRKRSATLKRAARESHKQKSCQ